MINTNEILSKYEIRLTKSLGQNFLTDVNIIRKIIDAGELTKEDLVLEIGPGIGALTVSLAEKAGKVIAIEIDRRLIPALKETTAGYKNITIVHGDILKTDVQSLIGEWNGRIKVISNLPYYVTTPTMMMFLENGFSVERMVLMVQKEVALRIAAKPGSKDYGSLSVGVQVAGVPKLLFHVSRHCFIPKPDVDSSVIRIILSDKYLRAIIQKRVFFQCVRAAFSQRRKTLLNSIGNAPNLNIGKGVMRQILTNLNLKENIRGEELSVEQFIEISNQVAEFHQ